MSEPSRIRDDPKASRQARALLAAASPTLRLPKAVRERSAARLDRALVLPAAAGLLFWLKGVALATGVVLVAVVAPKAVETLRPHAEVPNVAPSAVRATPLTRAVPPLPSAVVTAPASAAPTPALPPPIAPPRVSSPVAPEVVLDPLTREAMMLEKARAALDHDPNAALAMLDAHRAEFPAGTLTMERELVAVDALSRIGRVADARSRGGALLEQARGSIYEARVRALLDGLANR
jgi:hypothetical protein